MDEIVKLVLEVLELCCACELGRLPSSLYGLFDLTFFMQPRTSLADLLSRLSHALCLCLCTSYAATSSRVVRGGPHGVLADDSGSRGLDVGHVRSMTLPVCCERMTLNND